MSCAADPGLEAGSDAAINSTASTATPESTEVSSSEPPDAQKLHAPTCVADEPSEEDILLKQQMVEEAKLCAQILMRVNQSFYFMCWSNWHNPVLACKTLGQLGGASAKYGNLLAQTAINSTDEKLTCAALEALEELVVQGVLADSEEVLRAAYCSLRGEADSRLAGCRLIAALGPFARKHGWKLQQMAVFDSSEPVRKAAKQALSRLGPVSETEKRRPSAFRASVILDSPACPGSKLGTSRASSPSLAANGKDVPDMQKNDLAAVAAKVDVSPANADQLAVAEPPWRRLLWCFASSDD